MSFAGCLRPDGSIDPNTPSGHCLLQELQAFFEAWDSTEQVELESGPSWVALKAQAEGEGLCDIAAVIPGLMHAMGDSSDEMIARADIVRWVRAHILVARCPEYGSVYDLTDQLRLLGASHVNDDLLEQEEAMLD